MAKFMALSLHLGGESTYNNRRNLWKWPNLWLRFSVYAFLLNFDLQFCGHSQVSGWLLPCEISKICQKIRNQPLGIVE